MITPEIISRINQLARKQKEGCLTTEEQAEQTKLRRMYIDHIKGQVKAQLDASINPPHPSSCNCGCH